MLKREGVKDAEDGYKKIAKALDRISGAGRKEHTNRIGFHRNAENPRRSSERFYRCKSVGGNKEKWFYRRALWADKETEETG